MYHITFLRHGESQGNLEGILQGQKDYPLTAKGKRQAEALATYWKAGNIQFDWMISSSLQRASQTACIIAEALGIPLETDPVWKERSFGSLEGQGIHDLESQDPPFDFHHPYLLPGGTGESELDLYLRACRGVQDLLRRKEGRYLVVAHGAILNMALYACLGLSPQGKTHSPRFGLGNTGYATLRYDPQRMQWWLMSLVNPEMAFGEKEEMNGNQWETEIRVA